MTDAKAPERVELRRGGWFATSEDRERGWSGPWATREAAEAADREEYALAHELEREHHHAAFATPPIKPDEGEDETTWEVWQDDMLVASSTSEGDGRHYLAVYLQDGPASLVRVESRRVTVVATVPTLTAATPADAGEGE